MGRKECTWAISKSHEPPCFRLALAGIRCQNGLRDSAFVGQPLGEQVDLEGIIP